MGSVQMFLNVCFFLLFLFISQGFQRGVLKKHDISKPSWNPTMNSSSAFKTSTV